MMETVELQVVPLWLVEAHGGADIHLQATEGGLGRSRSSGQDLWLTRRVSLQRAVPEGLPPWKGPALERFPKNCCLWEGHTLDKFVKDCLP